jgi:hypothetical protein
VFPASAASAARASANGIPATPLGSHPNHRTAQASASSGDCVNMR